MDSVRRLSASRYDRILNVAKTPDLTLAFELSLKLSRLQVDPDQRARLTGNLGDILNYVDLIGSVDTDQVPAMVNPLEMMGRTASRLRADQSREQTSLTTTRLDREQQLYIVPPVLAQDD